jgi:hypothetical protein
MTMRFFLSHIFACIHPPPAILLAIIGRASISECKSKREQIPDCLNGQCREFSKKFEMTLMLFSGALGKMIHENLKQKISCHCPFKGAVKNSSKKPARNSSKLKDFSCMSLLTNIGSGSQDITFLQVFTFLALRLF